MIGHNMHPCNMFGESIKMFKESTLTISTLFRQTRNMKIKGAFTRHINTHVKNIP